MKKNYINNLETGKIELHFTKAEYKELSEDLKKELKSVYLFSRYAQAWVSRSKNNHYRAIQIAKKLGFTEEERQGKRLTYEEELNIKSKKAEHRIEHYENYANNAVKRAENLQSDLNKKHGDNTFFTQPNINSVGGKSFTNYRNRIINRYNKGFEEYRKSEYFQEKAESAQRTANKEQLKDRSYLSNRIKECNKRIKQLEKNITFCEDLIYKKENNVEITNIFYKDKTIEELQELLQEQLEKLEYQGDKKAFMENCLDKIGGTYSKENIKVGYMVKIRRDWELVTKVNRTTVQVKAQCGFCLKYSYTEIQEIKIPKNFKENKEELKNPYSIGDILVGYNAGGSRIIKAFQVLKITPKTVQLQKININTENMPIRNSFMLDKPCRKKIV